MPINSKTTGRLKFLVIAAIFITPMVWATLAFYFFPEWIPSGTTQKGVLVNPAQPLAHDMPLFYADGKKVDIESLFGTWAITFVVGGECDKDCADLLYLTRQVRETLNEKRIRVSRQIIFSNAAVASELRDELLITDPRLTILVDPTGAAHEFFQEQNPGDYFLVDPVGNWMMIYPADTSPYDLKKDLKKLMKVSQVG